MLFHRHSPQCLVFCLFLSLFKKNSARLQNPTTDVLEQRFAQMSGGLGALAVSSGTAAAFYSIINLAQQGDNFVSARNLYGGTYTQFNDILPVSYFCYRAHKFLCLRGVLLYACLILNVPHFDRGLRKGGVFHCTTDCLPRL